MRERYYNPLTRRFLNSDPAREGGNWFAYAAGNPLAFMDPTGLGITSALDSVQTALSFLGMVPVFGEVFDVVNAGISVARGNYGEAALNLASALPAVGNAIGGVKLAASVHRTTRSYKALSHVYGAENRVFWSGGDAAREAAEAFAIRTPGATTLELSYPGLQKVSDAMLAQGKDWATVVRPTVWEPASKSFAEGARGTVNVFQNAEGVSLLSVWRQVEYPVLKKNPGVTIRYHVVMPDGSVIIVP